MAALCQLYTCTLEFCTQIVTFEALESGPFRHLIIVITEGQKDKKKEEKKDRKKNRKKEEEKTERQKEKEKINRHRDKQRVQYCDVRAVLH